MNARPTDLQAKFSSHHNIITTQRLLYHQALENQRWFVSDRDSERKRLYCRMRFIIAAAVIAAIGGASAFSVVPNAAHVSPARTSPLFMGRAAAVRAATKSKTDARKAKTNAIYGKKIIMAVKQGGGSDPASNRQLNDVIKQAKANNVPVDNINRAIKRATEAASGDFSESTFEAYGFGGASFVINVLSDNANRATADVKSTVGKNNGKMAESGSVLFLYDRKGKIELPAVLDEEELLEAAIEAGCEDMELVEGDEEGTSIIYTDPKEVAMMADAVRSMGHEEFKMGLAYVPKAPVECTEKDFEKNMNLVDALEELDDVDSVEHNMSN